MQSFKKKIHTISENGLQPFIEGVLNKTFTNTKIEEKALKRAAICFKCPLNVIEPIESFKVKDKKIPELSNMMCDDCGCELPLKVRQDKEICKHWNEPGN